MPAEAWWLVLFIVAALVGPFAALKAVSRWRQRNLPPPLPNDDED